MFIVCLTVAVAGVGEVEVKCESEANAWVVFDSCIHNYLYTKGSIVINGKRLSYF